MNGFYYLTHLLGVLAAIGYMALIAPVYRFSRFRAAACVSSALAAGYLLMRLLYWTFTGEWGGQNTVRLIAFIPLFAVAFSALFKLRTRSFLDAAAPVICIVQGIAKIGCQQVGCCESFWQVDWGICNPRTGQTLFPIQLTESIVSLIIAGLLIWLILKKRDQTEGRLMPLMLILFGLTRFFLEFLRDNQKIVCGLSAFSLWSILIFAEGLVWFALTSVKNKKSPRGEKEENPN